MPSFACGRSGTPPSGGRSIDIDEVTTYLRKIYDDQYRRFDGVVAPIRHDFASPDDAAAHLKSYALASGADIVGVCEIERGDVYRGRTVTERYAVWFEAGSIGSRNLVRLPRSG